MSKLAVCPPFSLVPWGYLNESPRPRFLNFGNPFPPPKLSFDARLKSFKDCAMVESARAHGKWFVSIQVEREVDEPTYPSDSAVGLFWLPTGSRAGCLIGIVLSPVGSGTNLSNQSLHLWHSTTTRIGTTGGSICLGCMAASL